MHLHRRHGAPTPWQAIAGIVIGLLVLLSCGALIAFHLATSLTQWM